MLKCSLLAALLGLVPLCVIAAPDPNDRTGLEAFTDGFMASAMENHHVPGVVISVVSNGQVLFEKGYGVSDIEARQSVDPEKTLFRIASITKLLTWTAIMQLNEAGLVELDRDINDYLDGVQVPETFESPITLEHLLSHTPGFEDHVLGLFSRDESSLLPYAELLDREMPARMRPPGDLPAYSNHGTALAGLIVEQVSGLSWEDYIEQRIFQPLGMEHISVRQPVPEPLQSQLATGYTWQDGRFIEGTFEYVPLAPAGGGSSSAGAMARFMLAMLNEGEWNGARILNRDTARTMRSALFRADPRISAALHGFYEFSSNGQFILGHGGSTVWFQSLLMLLPEQDIGLFISTNSASGYALHSAYRKAWLDRYFPEKIRGSTTSFTPTPPDSVAGTYASLRSSFTDFTELGRILAPLVVAENEEGGLVVTGFSDPVYFEEIDSGLYHDTLSGRTLAFRFDETGAATHLFFGTAPSATFERLPWYHQPAVLQALLTLSSLFIGWALIAWPLQAIYSRRFREDPEVRYRRIGWAMAAVCTALAIVLVTATASADDLVFGITPGVKLLLMANYAIPLLALLLASRLPALWRCDSVGRWARLGYLGVLLAGILNSAMLFDWHMFYGL